MILFLDFDGVLHPDSVYQEDGQPVLRGEGSLFMWAPILTELLAPIPNVDIVLSTSWVQVMGYEYARQQLPAGLQERVSGRIRPRPWDTSRYFEIAAYVRWQQLSRWVALDDCYEWSEEDADRLVRCDPTLGISCPETQRLLIQRLEEFA